MAPWNDEILATGQRGELCARGYMVMKGYDREPDATARAVSEDGWLRTGDLAVMRDDGYLHFARPGEGDDHPRRREHLSAGDRGVPARIPRSRMSMWWGCRMRGWVSPCWRGSS